MRMYLSRLVLNYRDRAVRRDLADCQQMHRTIMSAFGEVSSGNGPRSCLGVLYRIESARGRPAVWVLVQSVEEPDWSGFPPGYLMAVPQCRRVDPVYSRIEAGMSFRFRLRANPTRKVDTKTRPDGRRRHGRRVVITAEEDLLAWLERKATAGGFEVLPCGSGGGIPDVRVQKESMMTRASSREKPLTFGSVVFEGRLRVTDRERFLQTLEQGIGTGKAYGFGLLSLARRAG